MKFLIVLNESKHKIGINRFINTFKWNMYYITYIIKYSSTNSIILSQLIYYIRPIDIQYIHHH